MKAIAYTNTLNIPTLERYTIKRISKLLLGISILLLVAYSVLLSRTIFAVVTRKTLENQNKTLTSSIAEMEVSYLKKTADLDLDTAKTLGFVESKDVTYVSRVKTALR